MKRLFSLGAVAVVAMAFAAGANAQISVGAGYASESVNVKSVYDLGSDVKGRAWQKDFRNLDGFYVEAAYNWEFKTLSKGSLSLQPGLRYTYGVLKESKAYTKAVTDEARSKSRSKTNISDHTLDIPVNLKYSYEFVPGAVKAYAFAGPVLSFGLACNLLDYTKTNTTVDGEVTRYGTSYSKVNLYNGRDVTKEGNDIEEKLEIQKDQDSDLREFDMFDLKLGLGLGVTLAEKVDVKFGYNIGLLNRAAIKADDGDRYKAHTNVLWFGVAYNF